LPLNGKPPGERYKMSARLPRRGFTDLLHVREPDRGYEYTEQLAQPLQSRP